jgi:hypothetical protein
MRTFRQLSFSINNDQRCGVYSADVLGWCSMSHSRIQAIRGAIIVLAICATLTNPSLSPSQTQPQDKRSLDSLAILRTPPNPSPEESIPACTAADLDATMQFAEEPEGRYTVAMDYRNISGHPCRLNNPDPMGFVPDKAANGARYELCYDCENRLPNGQYPIVRAFVLNPDNAAHVTYRWKTQATDANKPCIQPEWMHTSVNQDYKQGFLLVSRTLLKPICSPVDVGRYVPVFFAVQAPPLNIDLTADPTPHFPRQQINVSATLEEADESNAKETACPVLLQRTRSAEGRTRWDQFGGPADHSCKANMIENGKRQRAMQFDSGHNSRWDGLGVHTITLLKAIAPDKYGNIVIATSKPLNLRVMDNVSLARQWGPKIKGVAVDVTLDKDTYTLGEDIPLHIAMENFDADVPILGESTIWHPCDAAGVDVRDKCSHPIKKSQGIEFICMGSGPMGLWRYPKKAVVPFESTLRPIGLLPEQPGNYTVSATWSPFAGNDDTCNLCPVPSGLDYQSPYAEVHDTAAFRIIDKNHPQEGFSKVPVEIACADAGDPGFKHVATSFGPYTALKDYATGLKWLHLDLTANQSYLRVTEKLSPGKPLEGWRFATVPEVQQLFARFLGSLESYPTDASLVTKLQLALGGPLEDISNPSNGFQRKGLEGLVDAPCDLSTNGTFKHPVFGLVVDNSINVVTDPRRPAGCSWDNYSSPDQGSFLVQEDPVKTNLH